MAVVIGMKREEIIVIDGISGRPVPPPVSGGGDTALNGRVAEARPAAPAETARASGNGAGAVVAPVAAPSVDVDKVAALRAAIAAGSYRIDPVAIAQRIVAADQTPPGSPIATISA